MTEKDKKIDTLQQMQNNSEPDEDSMRENKKKAVPDTVEKEEIKTPRHQEPSHNQVLQALVDILRAFASKKAKPSRLDWIAQRLKGLRTIITTLIILILGFLFIFFCCRELKTESVLIEPFDVPQDLEKQGYTGRVIVNKLIDKINFVRNTARTSMESPMMIPIWTKAQVEIEILGAGISINSIVQYIKRFFGRASTRILGEIVMRNSQMFATTRVSGQPAKTISGGVEDLEEILLQTAQYIYKYVEPFILASYLYEIDRKASLETIQYILSHEPPEDDSWAYNLWGLILLNQGDYEGAIAKCQKAIEVDPKFALAYNNWGRVLDVQKDYEGAIAKYQKAISLDSKYASRAYNNWGVALMKQENYQGAVAAFQKVIELDPRSPYVYLNWGIMLERQKDYKSAIAKYRKAIEVDTKYVLAYLYCSDVLSETGNYKDAIAKIQKAVELNPRFPLTYIYWGDVLMKKEDYKGAIAKYQKTIELNPEGKYAEDARVSIKKLKEKFK